MLGSALIFTADVAIIAVVSWLSLRALMRDQSGLVEVSLSWLLLALEWIVSVGVLLGLFGWLNRLGFFFVHAVSLVTLLYCRRNWRADIKALGHFLYDWWLFLRSKTPEGRITLGLVLVIFFLAALAAQADPAVFDALTYRLSRIGQWLQDGRIANYQTDDPRINYMPVGPDLVVAWLLGATNEGFRLASLSQIFGGMLLLGATFGLARTVGLSRKGALGSVAIVLGMANVAVQFTTLQSDLFTAGVFSASYFLWHRALERGEGSWIAGMGIALAWGSKGTMFYLAPGAALWAGYLIWKHRFAWKALFPTVCATAFAGAIFVGPSYYRNIINYGSFFGPREAVLLHHGDSLSLSEHAEKLWVNLKTSSVQLFDPTTQPFWCRDALCAIGRKIIPSLSDQDDRYLFMHSFARRMLAEGILEQTEPDADILSCGMLAILFFFSGILIAIIWRRTYAGASQILVWGGGVLLYVLVQHGLVQWHQWAFRFFVLAAPWMAVVGAWGICQVSRRVRLVIWPVVVISSVQVFAVVQWRAPQAAWQAVTRPGFSMPQFVYSHWRTWGISLEHDNNPVRLALPINSPIGAFYRTHPAIPLFIEKFSLVRDSTAESAVNKDGGWMVVPGVAYMGREGNVMGKTWLMNGDVMSIHSLAAFRILKPGEEPLPMLYRSVHSMTADGIKRRLLVRSWQPQIKLKLQNPSSDTWQFNVQTAHGHSQNGVLSSVSELTVVVPVSNEGINEITIDFHSATILSEQTLYPAAKLIQP